MRFSRLIPRYLIQAVIPYFIFSWLLLSVILFVQQGSRYSEIFFSANIPKTLIWQLTFALVPNVIAFTCPMAALVAVIIGFARMQGDGELVSMKAAGVGNLQLIMPVVFLGILLSAFTFFINLYGVPFAARMVRQVALQTALYKLESPIEPGVFNTEINGYTIYAKDGNLEKGTWENIFIYNEDKQADTLRLITSKGGRIDSNDETSELVLDGAIVNTISFDKNREKIISESIGQTRFAIKTKRAELIDKLSSTEASSDELGIRELYFYAKTKEGREKTEIDIIFHRRIILSLTPLIFALLGASLILKFNRRGKGFGVFLAILSLMIYYLLTLLGEQLARTSRVKVLTASLLPIAVSLVFIGWFFLSERFSLGLKNFSFGEKFKINLPPHIGKILRPKFSLQFNTALLDFDIISSLIKYFILTLSFLTLIFIIFTAFELWKFAGEMDDGATLLLKYLFYLLPFIYIQIAPSALMIATLTAFVIKSRQNEIVTWTNAGRSVYRLLFPCLAFMIFLGFLNWQMQEKLLPKSNQIQESLRARIRNRGGANNKEVKYWVSNDNRIYSFELAAEKSKTAQRVKNLLVFEFSPDNVRLQTVYKAPEGLWETDKIKFLGETEKIYHRDGKIELVKIGESHLPERFNPFAALYQKPSYLNTEEIKERIENTEAESEKRNYETALEKKYATLFLPFVITLFTAPFALSLHRKGRVATVGYAIGVWLLFIGAGNVFEQFGQNGYIAPAFAVWSPLLLFTMLGIFLISRIKT